MRYSLFAGLPLGVIALTAVYEIAQRYTTYDASVVAGLLALALVLFGIHKWDERRLDRLLHPQPRAYPVDRSTARENLTETLRQIEFEDAAGLRTRWRLGEVPELDDAIVGKVRVKSRAVNPNIVAWLLDLIDQGHKARTIYLRLEFAESGDATKVSTSYTIEPLLDWSRCEEVIQETNQWLHESLSRSEFDRSGWL